MSNLSSVINDNLTNLKGASFHFKAYGILCFVSAGFMILAGIPLLLFLGLGIIYIAIGILYIFLGLNLTRSSDAVKSIINVPELTQDDYNTNSMKAILELKKHFKILNILVAVSLGLGLILGIAFAAFIPSFINQINQLENGSMLPTSSSYRNPTKSKLQGTPNPYETQSNKSQTAGQMGMTDQEHTEMHDPKNIENTDYSQLDYSNALKESEAAYKNAMDKMTPEQKAAMEKMMSELKK
jgi:Family of unknown function (DUF5362)